MPLPQWLEAVTDARVSTGQFILPDGVKSLQSRGYITILVHETPPRVHCFKWIMDDSPVDYGGGTKYQKISIAIPYLITFAVFQEMQGKIVLTQKNECFFSNKPLSSLSNSLCYPALLNISKFPTESGNPLAWICTQHLNWRRLEQYSERNQYMREAFKELMRTLLDSGFNRSSEQHEGASWWGVTQRKKVDPRINDIDTWQENTKKDPLFVLEIPWIETGYTAEGIVERIFATTGGKKKEIRTADELAKVVFKAKG